MSTDRACLPTHLVGSLPRDAYPNTLHHPVTLSRPAGALHHRVRLTRGGAVWREQRPAVGVGQQLASAAGCALSQCGASCMSHEPYSTKHAPCNMQACMGHGNIATLQRAASRCMVHGVQRQAATCIRQHAPTQRRMHRDCSWWFAVSGPSARTGLPLQGSARLSMSLSPQGTCSSARCKCAEYPYPPGPTAASLIAHYNMRAPTNMDVRSLSHSTCASMRTHARTHAR